MSTFSIVLSCTVLLTSLAKDKPTEAPQSPEAAGRVATGNNAFAVALYQKLSASPGNLFFSPISLSTALAMTYAGAKGDTAKQMAEVLRFPTSENEVHSGYGAVVRGLNAVSPDYELSVANALWAQKGQRFLRPFLDTVRNQYGAGLDTVDFAANPESARKTINAQITKQTRNKIQELLKPGDLKEITRLVLTDAVYFKGAWAKPFKKTDTQDGPFHLTADKIMTAPLMNMQWHFDYMENAQIQGLQLPHRGAGLTMVVLLPKAVDGLPELERALTPESFSEWMKGFSRQEVRVTIPRVKMTSQFELSKTLGEMGMPLAFSGKADFSNMAGKDDLFLSAVVHKAFVDVTEEGTEAAAATGAVIGLKSEVKAIRLEEIKTFRADHPFLVVIRDLRTGAVLFMGRVINPAV